MNIAAIVLALIVGIIFGGTFVRLMIVKLPKSGDIIVTSDTDGCYLALELENGISDDILNRDIVMFRVKDLTRK